MSKYGFSSFAFIVITMNHEEYILEHLESIKYLIGSYGNEIDFQIIVADDCSSDRTVMLVDEWLAINENHLLFNKVDKIYNTFNVGTCKNVINALSHVDAEHCKITAGDDVYSYENFFPYISHLDKYNIVSGLPLHVMDDVVYEDRFYIFNIYASDEIYKKKLMLDRYKLISVSNSPNVFYSLKNLKHHETFEFLSDFDVVEDWPIKISISAIAPHMDSLLIDKVFVYYRRTQGSIYLKHSKRFNEDKRKIFDYLIRSESSFLKRLLIKSRATCFSTNKAMVKRFCNLARYHYMIYAILNLSRTIARYKKFDPKLEMHRDHYFLIKERALIYKERILGVD